MADKQLLTGISGRQYEFSVHEIGATFAEQAGVFVFAKEQHGLFEIVLVGEVNNFKVRLTDQFTANPEFDDIKKNRVSHIMVCPIPDKDMRQKIVNDLCEGFELKS